MRNVSHLAIAALTLSISLAGSAYAADPVKVGVTVTQSPPGSVSQGTQVKDGMEIVKIINDKGGVLGRPIKLVYEDTQGIPEKARAAVEKLITRDKVVALAGGHQSSSVLAAIEVAHRYKVPYVNTNGWSDAIRNKGYPEVFNPGSTIAASPSPWPNAEGAGRQARRRLRREHGLRHRPGQAHGEKLKQTAPQVDYKYETLDRTSKDFPAAVLPLRANPPDVIVHSCCRRPPTS